MTVKELETRFKTPTRDNCKDLILAVRKALGDGSVPSLGLQGYLDKVIDGFRPDADKDLLTVYGRIVAADMLLLQRNNSLKSLREKLLLFIGYAAATVKSSYDFVGLAVNALCYKVIQTGLDWKAVEDADSLDLLSYKLINGISFDKSSSDFFSFTGKGKAECRNGRLRIFSANVGENGDTAYSVFGGAVEIVTPNSRDAKLKASEQNDAEALGRFARNFAEAQKNYVNKPSRKRSYANGDKVDICLTGLSEDEQFQYAETLDDFEPTECTLYNEELYRGINTQDLFPYLRDGEIIRGAEVVKFGDSMFFSVKAAYQSFANEAAKRDSRDSKVAKAKVIRVLDDIKRINWISSEGYGGISNTKEGETVRVGDVVPMTVKSVLRQNNTLYINLIEPWNLPESPLPEFDDDKVFKSFQISKREYYQTKETESREASSQDLATVRLLTSILADRSAHLGGLLRYRSLLSALFLSIAAGDDKTRDKLLADAYYLRRCLSYAQNSSAYSEKIALSPEREAVLHLLSLPDSALKEFISAADPDTLPGKIALLRSIGSLSKVYPDELKSDSDTIRRSICEILGVGDAFRAEGEARTGKYGLTEGHETEFKASYVFRNDGKGPDIGYQGRGQVFEAVCGFLNADGGTLFLGVTDAGEPILDSTSGLQADIKWMCANFDELNKSRKKLLGHSVIKPDSLEHYALFLNSEKEIYFKGTLLPNITIEPTPDLDAIRITVAPAEYEIAYLYSDRTHTDGVAYVRDGGRTILMTEAQKARRLTSLKRISKEMDFIVTIQEAIDQHRKLILKDYASGSSGNVRDRIVVPVNLFYNDESVYCLDLDTKKYKQFRLMRIGSIETEMEDPVYTLPLQPPIKADVFRWTDMGSRYHIKLRMDIAARNIFVEEYSMAKFLPEKEFYRDSDGKWILDTVVYRLGAVSRFYLGLADKIEILPTEDSPALKDDIARFLKENLA